MLNWADRFSIFCFLNGNGYASAHSFPIILAAGARRKLSLQSGNAFSSLRAFHREHPSWLFGHFSYDLMTETLGVVSRHQPGKGFDHGFFFEPEILIRISENEVSVIAERDSENIFSEIMSGPGVSFSPVEAAPTPVHSRAEYEEIISRIRDHIQRGDCYELNFCMPFIAEGVRVNPVALYSELNRISPNPFSSLYKNGDRYCICASPERFLRKEGSAVLSQPMKGTVRRSEDPEQDEALRSQLSKSSKDRSENVMIVDLVRNDLSKFSCEGTVEVTELFGVHSYPRVHQMVSTIRGTAREDVHWTDIIASCFPMGSMTGAPKKRVAELIDLHEQESRGLYSGSIGYIDPEGNFDLNVVIRSIFYDRSLARIHFWVGGGITHYSKASDEYEECMLKAGAMMQVLSGQ